MAEPVLITPDLDKKMRVEANASDFAIKEVLSMKYKNEKWRLVITNKILTGCDT